MSLARYSLNHLHAFAVAARYLNMTRAADELCVTQAAVSHQIKALEAQIGKPLFLRTARGLQLSDEGERIASLVQQAFAQLETALALLDDVTPPQRFTLAVVGTYLHGYLLERLPDFQARHPAIDLRIQTHNNKLDLATETMDAAIRFGDGAWRRVEALPLQTAPLTALCAPELKLKSPQDLHRCTLLRSYRSDDWAVWALAAGCATLNPRGPQFDASVLMVQAAMAGAGVALAPAAMFRRELASGRLVQPFATEVDVGRYWLTRSLGRDPPPAFEVLREWLVGTLPPPARPGSSRGRSPGRSAGSSRAVSAESGRVPLRGVGPKPGQG